MSDQEMSTKPKTVLVIGGAGFIGTHLVRRLLSEGCSVTILDNFSSQIHESSELPPDIRERVLLYHADICDRAVLVKAVEGQDAVVHLAAETGTGQSMYSLVQYERVNSLGTAQLLEVLASGAGASLKRLVLSSSRAVYGEGKYRCERHGAVYPSRRSLKSLERKQFEPECPICGSVCSCMPTDESSRIDPTSIYGLTKFTQERMVVLCAPAMRFTSVVLRYQNVFGPGQSLRNPYTGILAIFSTLARQDATINVFEDGRESRDFVYIDDVIDATWRAIIKDISDCEILNVGSGHPTTVQVAAEAIVGEIGSKSPIVISGQFRVGDIRHNVADLERCERVLGYHPKVEFKEGLQRFLEWTLTQATSNTRYEESLLELKSRGLLNG